MRGLKMVSLAVVLLSAVLCVASVGVTESWWSDTDDTVIGIETADLSILIDGVSWNGASQRTLGIGEHVLKSNYSVTLEFAGEEVILKPAGGGSQTITSLVMTAGTEYTIEVGGNTTTTVTLGGGVN